MVVRMVDQISLCGLGATNVVLPKLLYINSETVIPAKAGIQLTNTGFPRIKYGAGLVKPGMTIKVKGLLTQYTKKKRIGLVSLTLILPILERQQPEFCLAGACIETQLQ
jgi:hypothetical protein